MLGEFYTHRVYWKQRKLVCFYFLFCLFLFIFVILFTFVHLIQTHRVTQSRELLTVKERGGRISNYILWGWKHDALSTYHNEKVVVKSKNVLEEQKTWRCADPWSTMLWKYRQQTQKNGQISRKVIIVIII